MEPKTQVGDHTKKGAGRAKKSDPIWGLFCPVFRLFLGLFWISNAAWPQAMMRQPQKAKGPDRSGPFAIRFPAAFAASG
jgi:hypothetical protein